MQGMNNVAVLAAVVAALIHIYFFILESVWFMRPEVWSRFGISSDAEAKGVRSWAFNQGFYNLFLAAGVVFGIALVAAGQVDAGRAIVTFACGSMAAAGVVLYLYNRAFLRAAAIQLVPALIAVLATLFLS
jgi:putative membrane protein